ncbi:MAG: DNA translocase FtsK 4TM domain-containing protein [Deltaproteobacteria bacterium]|nr:DNA translocase FtsK 4TM domain-containing protein [Deltaproteobacteria bacterium]
MARRGGRRRASRRYAQTDLAQPGRLEAEVIFLTLFTVAGFVELALLSYVPSDPWWGFGSPVENRCGPVGALIAAGLAGSLGWAAHVLPLAGLVVGVRYLRGLPVRPRWIPLVAWSVFWLTLAASFEVLQRAVPSVLPPAAGGRLGRLVVVALEQGVYLTGTTLLLSIALVSSLLIATGVSARDLFRTLGRGLQGVASRLARFVVVSWARLRRRWERLGAAATESRSARAQPNRRMSLRLPPLRRAPDEPEVVEHRLPIPRPARQESLPFTDGGSTGPYKLPDLEMLAQGVHNEERVDRDCLIKNSQILEHKLADFSVKGRVVKVHPGPVITMYEFEPAPGIKLSRIVNLADDLALALRAMTVRIVAPIPGKNVVGIEVPNAEREVVVLRDLLAHPSYHEAESKLTIVLGKDIFGHPVTMELSKMPHLLVAGATGTGKSVFLNALLCSLFFKATPDEVKLLLIDPKMLEFSMFRGVPHLIADVVTNPKRAAAALMGVVAKMEERYHLMAERGVRNIAQYNRLIAKETAHARPKPDDEIVPRPLPYIVVVIDELADLMIVAQRDVEESLIRLAQMARAAGIHLVLATQRPSVDVLTGLIKANFPARISFQVSSRTDSRTVLDANGAERLLGAGDMLFMPPGSSKLERIHGPYISEKEVLALTAFLTQQGSPEFDPTIIRLKEESRKREERGEDYDELFNAAMDIVATHRIASISFIQRKLKIGYNRAARLIEQMEAEGMVGPQEGTKAREIFLRPPDA